MTGCRGYKENSNPDTPFFREYLPSHFPLFMWPCSTFHVGK